MTRPESSQDDRFPVVVIGGGLAGLTAALHLAARGIPPLVLEADNEWPGGRLSGGAPDSFHYDGQTWTFPGEHGVHAMWGAYTNMRSMLARFLDVELVESAGEEWINRWGDSVRRVEAGVAVRWGIIPAPLHYLQLLLRPRFWGTITPLDFLSLPGFLTSLALTLGIDPIREGLALDGLTLRDYFNLWTPNLRATFTGIGTNMLAADADSIPLASFIAALRFYTLLRRNYWTPAYLPGNPHQTLIQPLIARIEERGGQVLLGARGRVLQREGDGWQLRFEDARLGGHRVLAARHVILATDPQAARTLLADSPDTPLDGLRFPAVTRNSTLRLWYDVTPRDGASSGMFTGHFMMDNFFWLHRLYDAFRPWHQTTGGSALEVHIYNRTPLLDQPARLIQLQISNEVGRAFPELRGHLVHSSYRSNGYTQTLFRVPDAHSLHVQTPWPNLWACGDWVGHPHQSLNMERSIVTGIAAANAVLSAEGCPDWEILPLPPPELPAQAVQALVRAGRWLLGPVVGRVLRRGAT